MDYLNLTKEDIIQGVNNKSIEISYLSESQKDEQPIVFEVINKNNNWIFQPSPQKIKNIVLKVGKIDLTLLIYTSELLRNDRDIILEVVKNNGSSLQYASKILRDDKTIVLEAVNQNCWALFFASERLMNDKDILEVLEKEGVEHWYSEDEIKWYQERMEVLANIRNQEEKEIMEKAITDNSIKAKKIKF